MLGKVSHYEGVVGGGSVFTWLVGWIGRCVWRFEVSLYDYARGRCHDHVYVIV